MRTPRTQDQTPGWSKPHSGQPVDETIRVRAYQKWLQRGQPANSAVDDWLEAEAECQQGLPPQHFGVGLQTLLETTTDVVFMKDGQGRYVLMNAAGARFIGKPVAAILGRDDRAFFPAPLAQTLMEADQRLLAAGGTEEYEFLLPGAEGPRTFHTRKTVCWDDAGQAMGLVGIARDISERKHAEKALAQMAAIVESSNDAIIGINLEGLIFSWNPSAERLFGYSPAEVRGQPITLLHPPECIEEEQILSRIRSGTPIYLEETVRLRKDGKLLDVSLAVSPIKNGHGVITGASGIVRDITRHMQVSRRLAAEHAVTKVLAESVDLVDAAPGILKAICESLGWVAGCLWRVDRKAGMLCCVEIWHAPAVAVVEFEQLCRRLTFSPGEGLPGRVWATKKPAWIADVVRDRNFPRLAAADREGLHAAFGFPIRMDDQILGVLEFFHHEILQPDADLLDMLGSLGSQIGQFIERRRAEKSVQERSIELKVAQRIQEGLLPRTSPAVPGFQIGAHAQPANETGGDYFDFLTMGKEGLGIVLGDASGHGVGAALLMAETRAYLRALATTRQLGKILALVNERLTEDTQEEHFVTLFLACLHPQARYLTYCNAGHLPGFILDKHGQVRHVLTSTSPPLGLGKSRKFATSPGIQLQSGELLFLFTDGISEAFDPTETQFGIERALAVVHDHCGENPQAIVDTLLEEVDGYSKGVQTDDRTAIMVRVE